MEIEILIVAAIIARSRPYIIYTYISGARGYENAFHGGVYTCNAVAATVYKGLRFIRLILGIAAGVID